MPKDKLSEDKKYLRSLRKTITENIDSNSMDSVTRRLSQEVEGALQYLNMREELWRQINLNSIWEKD